MVKVGSLLGKLRCRKVKDEDAAVDGKRTVQEMHNNVDYYSTMGIRLERRRRLHM